MILDLKKDKIQREAFTQWKSHNKFAHVLIGTGGGKGRLGCMAINEYNGDKPIVIAVDNIELREKTWKEHLKKWSVKPERVHLECYQTLYKWKDTHIGLLVADEFDFSLTPKYSLLYFNNKIDQLLGLSATYNGEKKYLAAEICPRAYTYTTNASQKDNIINDTVVVLHKVPLYTHPTIRTKNGLMSELDYYIWIDKKVNQIQSQIDTCRDSFTYHHLKRQYKWAVFKRARILYELSSTVDYTRKLCEKLTLEKGNKVLIFTKYTKTADRLGNSYHSKNQSDCKDKFNAGQIKWLSVCKSLGRGVNMMGLNHVIGHSFDGSETTFEQSLKGRATRLDSNDTAYIHLLVPVAGVKYTRAKYWFDKITAKSQTIISSEHFFSL